MRLSLFSPRTLRRLSRLVATLGAAALCAGLAACSTTSQSGISPKTPAATDEVRFDVTHDYIAGMTLQRISSDGLRWMSFEENGTWHTVNAEKRPIAGTWTIRNGGVCMTDDFWFPDAICWAFYGAPDEIRYVQSDYPEAKLQPSSIYRTDDPTDGVGEVMAVTKYSQFPFPARVDRLFARDSELIGLRIQSSTGDWFEFRSKGQLVYGHGSDSGSYGKWKISQYYDLVLITGIGRDTHTTWYELLGSDEIAGIRDYRRPQHYYRVTVSRAAR